MSTVYNKVTLNGTTIMDISEDTVEASVLFQNYIAHGADGEEVIGSASSGVYTLELEQDQTDSTVFLPVGNFNTIFNALESLYPYDVFVYPAYGDTTGWYVGQGESGGYIPPMFADDKTFIKWIEYYTYQGVTVDIGISYVIVTDIVYGITDENVEEYGIAYQGTYTLPLTPQTKSKSYTPTESAQSETISADNGYSLSSVSVSVGAISSSYVGSGVTRRLSSDLSALGATVTAPSGYYSSNATKTISSGTEGTPTATKGTVNNHAISVTPSVTNTAGYISGGTHNGTAVSVSASELVSGSETKTANGTYDVTNLASLVVALEYSTITVSSSNPTGGSNGDVWIKTS